MYKNEGKVVKVVVFNNDILLSFRGLSSSAEVARYCSDHFLWPQEKLFYMFTAYSCCLMDPKMFECLLSGHDVVRRGARAFP